MSDIAVLKVELMASIELEDMDKNHGIDAFALKQRIQKAVYDYYIIEGDGVEHQPVQAMECKVTIDE
jgi:hypothetical protein